jgi:hypothetical protein
MNCLDNSHDHRGHGPYPVTTQGTRARSSSKSQIVLKDFGYDDVDFVDPLIVFGGRNKLSPLQALMDVYVRARDALRVRRVVVVGYSFRDPHINQALSRNAGEIVVCDPNKSPEWERRVRELFPNTETVPKDYAPELGVRLRRLFGASDIYSALHLSVDELPQFP